MALFNFRSDRMVEISKAFEYEDFNAFDRKRFPKVTPFSLPSWLKALEQCPILSRNFLFSRHSCLSL